MHPTEEMILSTEKNIRRHRRISYAGPIRVSWEERGEPRFAFAKCIDISEDGLRIEVPQAIVPAGASIQLAAERIKLAGAATVKHSVRRGARCLLGIELAHAVLDQTIAALQGLPEAVSS
jgi:hypothetical protein